MPIIISLIIAFSIGFALHQKGKPPLIAWLLSGCAVPILVLFAEFVLPYSGGGASMWPIAMIVGAAFGLLAGWVGVCTSIFLKRKSNKNT